ncbi:hypothetical protein [Stutzerimonas nitrititolerans]|uniref:hypothetical protein n=1 Tax=Stutzerimonas nitrititolerans TaxID=2482751 RepID=UPI00289C83EE|nr:hypothetical protein [Stutzerimonas nitrititolerans]
MKFLKNSYIRAILWPGLLGISLSACSALGSFGGETFTLEGELPANFSLKAQAQYSVANECNGRWQAKTFQSNFDSAPHQYRFKIPVSYRDGLCEMKLGKVGLFIYGRYGDKDWQQTYDNGGLVIVDKLPEGAPAFGEDGVVAKTAVCSWWFQLSKAKSRRGEISKLLSCKGAGAYLPVSELDQKTVRLNFEVDKQERPYLRGYWLKTQRGWKPCTGRWVNKFEELCTEPPQFRAFRMSGRECTVYPNCTE